jgi:tetratricopeptide (TPR) repeat protein
MNFSDDFFDADSNSFIDDEKLKHKVQKCKEYVSNGQTITFLGNIEDTIQLCLEYDFTEDGIFLTEAALEISPYSSELWHSKGIFYNNMFEFEKAYLCFDKALSMNPSDVEAMMNKSIAEDNLGMWDEAISTLENAISIEPNNEEISFNLGIFYERKDYYEKAIEHFVKTVSLDKDYGDAWYELGFCYESNNQLEEALIAYENFLNIEPYSASGWYNFGIVQLRMKAYEKAINSFELATAVNEDFANAWYNCGIAYSKINRYIDSRQSFLKAYKIDPFDDAIPLNIAQSFEATGDYDSSISYFNETIKISKSNIDAYIGLGNCYARRNNREQMLENFSMIIKYNLLSNLSEYTAKNLIELLNDNYAEIETYLNSSQTNEQLFNLADSYFEVGQWDKAFVTYKKTLESNSEKSNSYYGMSLCLFMLGENEKALQHLLKSFELNTATEVSFLDEFPNLESTHLYVNLTDTI